MSVRAVGVVLAAAIALGTMAGCVSAPPPAGGADSVDAGYFLSLRQKGQLIGSGRIQDGQGRWYDIWIVPGYVQPAQRARRGLGRSGRAFAEYAQPAKYHDLAEASGDAFSWAYEDCLVDFTVKGLPRAWDDYWSTANRRVERRVFGWWVAYPWAFMETTVDTAVRIPAGLGGAALGAAAGAVAVPGYYAVNSAVEGIWYGTVDGVVLPTAAAAWNTLMAPPLALLGQKPAPSRADGFWMKQLDTDAAAAGGKAWQGTVTTKDIEALAAWGERLVTVTQPYEARRQALCGQAKAEHEAINRRLQAAEAGLAAEQDAAIGAMAPDAAGRAVADYLRQRGFDAAHTSGVIGEVRQHLRQRKDLSPETIRQILDALRRYPPVAAGETSTLRPKTDPLQHSLDTVKELP